MLVSVAQEFRKFARHCYTLKVILKDTLRSLDDIRCNPVLGGELKEKLLNHEFITTLQHVLDDCYPVFLVFGQHCHAKALFINYILEQSILPLHSSNWRWVRISYGHTKEIRLTLGQEYEIVEKLQAHEGPWITVPENDLLRSNEELAVEHCPALDIKLNNSFLKDKVNLLIPPDCSWEQLSEMLTKSLDNVLPVIVYVISEDVLNQSHIHEICKIKKNFQDVPILFVNMTENEASLTSESLTESEQHFLEQATNASPLKKNIFSENKNSSRFNSVTNQLVRLGYLRESDENHSTQESHNTESFCTQCTVINKFINDYECKDKFVEFVQRALKSYLLKMSSMLSEVHNYCLKSFVLTAFDMAREIQITPRRIKYAQATEGELYLSLMTIAGQKQEEITRIIHSTLQDMKSNAGQILEDYCFRQDADVRQQSLKHTTNAIQQIVLTKLGNLVANQLVKSVGCLHESFTGTLQRCLKSLEKDCHDQDSGSLLASDAVKQIISAAYSIELKSSTSISVVQTFMERLRKLLQNFQMPWAASSPLQCDFHWQLQVISNTIDSLSSSKLAKTVSTQFQEVVKGSHESFQSAMRSLENQLTGKLEQTEEQRIAIRKQYAPRFARLSLESTSLCDVIRFGMPVQNREIGRGQYGVVFACDRWGGVDPCAVKSVVPPDDRHWNDLAMEFYYTRTIPEHPRIVKLKGSVIDHQYGGGSSSAVLLVMERMKRDLYCGLRSGLKWTARLQIAIDVIEGIRYLHSQGLVHRDIKLKNVLLDNQDRAKLTDFGFCIPEAMMSGSIVGTPVHMAPELLSGHYDSSVDVYAFGILFWYICANQVRLPYVFEQFHNKEQLWTSVRKGVRPECLPHFSEACWNLMEQCWAAEPSARPLLGNVQPILESIRRNAVAESVPSGKLPIRNCSPPFQRRKIQYVDSYCYDRYPLVFLREF